MKSQDGRRPVIQIPSHTEVYNGSQRCSTSFFQPSNPGSSSRAANAGPSNPPSGPAVTSVPMVRPSLNLPDRGALAPDLQNFLPSNNGGTVNTNLPSAMAAPPFGGHGRSFANSSTFTEAFAFVKDTRFYEPPLPTSRNSGPPSTSAPFSSGPATGTNSVMASSTAALHQNRNAIIVSKRQQGNPVLKHIRNVRWVVGDIVPDYLLGATACALYISLRYHLLHPEYLYSRIRELQRSFRLRVILCHVDVEDVIKPLHEVTKTALINDCTLFCAWSVEECARYLETIKVYENKPADAIQERTDNDYISRLTSAVTSIRHVNKTDVLTLGANFGTLACLMQSSTEDLTKCPGIGEKKVKRLHDAFHEPFRRTTRQKQLLLGNSVAAPKEPESKGHSTDGESSKRGASVGAVEEAEREGGPQSGQPDKVLSVKEALVAARAALKSRAEVESVDKEVRSSDDEKKEDA